MTTLHRKIGAISRETAIAVTSAGLLGSAALARNEYVVIESNAFAYEPGPASLAEGAEYQVLLSLMRHITGIFSRRHESDSFS